MTDEELIKKLDNLEKRIAGLEGGYERFMTAFNYATAQDGLP